MHREFIARSSKRGMDSLVESSRSSAHTQVLPLPEHKTTINVDISLRSILLVLATIGIIYFGLKLVQVLVLLFLAFILSSSALPLVKGLTNHGVPKSLSIFVVYLLISMFFLGTLTLILVPFVTESQTLIGDLPSYLDAFVKEVGTININGRPIDVAFILEYKEVFINWASNSFASGSGSEGVKTALSTVFGLAGGLVSIVTMLFMSVYMVTDHDNFVDLVLLRIVDEQKRTRVRKLVFDVEEKLGNWLIGQLTLSFIIGALTWLLLTFAGVPFALPFAVLAGLLESIPNIGPIIAAVPAVLVALVTGGFGVGVVVLLGCLIIQQLENSVIVPRVMANAVGLKPIVVVLAVASGFTLAGPIGALISIPTVVLLEILFQFYQDLQKLKAKGIV
ncbi:AI-2E family transporter [bacterium]|nr:AI-2E family transporter [bacterium]